MKSQPWEIETWSKGGAERRSLPPSSTPVPGERISVYLSIFVTRRKRFHYVMGGRHEPLFIAQNASAIFEYLKDHDVKKFDLHTETIHVRITMRSCMNIEGQENGQGDGTNDEL